MKATPQAEAIVKGFEKCRLVAYKPVPTDPWTIGWGHTRGVKEGDTCTQEQADAWLEEDMQAAVDAVCAFVKVNINPGQFAALVAFVFNVGAPAFGRSTLLKRLNESSFSLAAAEFPKWSFSGGQFLEGLHRRRLAEQAAFVGKAVETIS